MGWKYKPDHVGTGAYLRTSPALYKLLEARAHVGLEVARSLAPKETGRLAASGHVEFDGIGGDKSDRMQFSVVFDVSYAAAATFPPGNINLGYLEAAKAAMEG